MPANSQYRSARSYPMRDRPSVYASSPAMPQFDPLIGEYLSVVISPAAATNVTVRQSFDVMRNVRTSLTDAMRFLDANPDALRPFNIFSSLRGSLITTFGAQAVTNAWLKMRELVMHINIASTNHIYRVFCNAELPGAFVSALNHYVRTNHPELKFEWAASSLYPSEGVDALGDRYGLYAKYPGHWVMDAGMRGDVTNPDDVRAIATRAKQVLCGEVDLYTSDVGIDVSADYGRQEELSAHVHLGQIVTGLLMLRPGGSLIAKTFTFTHPFSVALLGQLADLFDQVRIDKPATSRPTNSEVYVVCSGFHGISPQVAGRLLRAVGNFDLETLAAESKISTSVAAAARQATAVIHGRQVEALVAARQRAASGRVHKYRRVRKHQGRLWTIKQKMTFLSNLHRL